MLQTIIKFFKHIEFLKDLINAQLENNQKIKYTVLLCVVVGSVLSTKEINIKTTIIINLLA